MVTTTYSEALPTDRDVAAFIALHPLGPSLLPLRIKKVWVARSGGKVFAVLVLRSLPFLALNYLCADHDGRTFMRLWKLWQMAECWLLSNAVPMIAVEVHDSRRHFQFLLRKAGFEAIGTSEAVGSTVFGKVLDSERSKEVASANS